jgi:hypothetical protein
MRIGSASIQPAFLLFLKTPFFILRSNRRKSGAQSERTCSLGGIRRSWLVPVVGVVFLGCNLRPSGARRSASPPIVCSPLLLLLVFSSLLPAAVECFRPSSVAFCLAREGARRFSDTRGRDSSSSSSVQRPSRTRRVVFVVVPVDGRGAAIIAAGRGGQPLLTLSHVDGWVLDRRLPKKASYEDDNNHKKLPSFVQTGAASKRMVTGKNEWATAMGINRIGRGFTCVYPFRV